MRIALKRSIIMLLSMSILFIVICPTANAITITWSGICGNNAKWSYSNGTLSITGSGEMYDYSSVYKTPWYGFTIQRIDIQPGITKIGKYAFGKNERLISVSIPETVQIIGDNAFVYCNSLESVILPKRLVSLGWMVFYECTSLREITIPASIKNFGLQIFDGCTNLRSVVYEEGCVTTGGTSMFGGCINLTNVTFPKSIKTIANGTFYHCDSFTSFSIPVGVTVIEDNAFNSCVNLSTVFIPDTVTAIGNNAFISCQHLESITIPDSVLSIGDRAFNACAKGFTIHSPYTSFARNWAEAKNIPWVSTTPYPTPQIFNFVSRCYQMILNRQPDPSGLDSWAGLLAAQKNSASEIISGFTSSLEFKNRNLGNKEVVEVLYRTMLDRDPDAAGLAAWTDVLNQGYPFGSVINGFCGSDEFKALCAEYGIQPGSVNVGPVTPAGENKIKAFVRRCYSVILGRDADPDGLNAWAEALETGVRKASEIIDGFVNSPEFLNKNLSNEASVKVLYQAMLGRDPDPAGLAAWTQVLDDGNPFGAVINGFCGSTEFINLCAEYGIQPGSVQVKAAFVKRVSITPEGSDAEGSATYVAYASEYINEEKIRAFVKHCYETVLGREGDEEGIANYTALVMDGKKTPKRVAYEFVFSPEFQNQLPGNEELIRILYRLYLNREPGAEELAGWIEMLDGGAGLDEVLKGFAESAEFRAIMREMKE